MYLSAAASLSKRQRALEPCRWAWGIHEGRRYSQMMTQAWRRIALVAVFAIALLAAACGGGDEEPAAPTPSEPFATSAAASTPVVAPTVNPEVPLVTYESAEMGYSIGYPEGWEYRAGSGGLSDFFIQGTPQGRVFAQVSVTCAREEGVTADSLILRDAANVASMGVIDSRTAVPVQVSGVEGKSLRYFVNLGELTIEHVVAYAVVGECGWRIGLNTFGAGTLDPYVPLFERIVDTFRSL